ncbi:hypothetical protein OSB04_014460, partial [Centaurea solstitialis]
MSGWISSKLKIDQQAAESLRKNEASRSDDDLSRRHAIPKKSSDLPPPLKDQLLKKKKTPPEKSDFVARSRGNVKVSGNEVGVSPNVNPKSSSLTDSDWTELLSAEPSKIANGSSSNVGVSRVPGLLKDTKRQVRSGSNLLALERRRSPTVSNKSVRRSDVVLGDRVNGDNSDGNQRSDGSGSTIASVGVQSVAENSSTERKDASGSFTIDKKELPANTPKIQPAFSPVLDLNLEGKNEESSGLPITSSSSKTDSRSASDGESNSETDSDSSSDSESEREKEERRKRREKLLAEKAAAKAIEAIKDRENLVARLEGEKQSLEKIIDERAKQQAQEASELQTTMMETMEAVDLEKQKHNDTRMEALMKLAKLETTNAELAKSLATAQWRLEVEVKRLAELHREIELKEANHKGPTSKEESHPSGNKLTASRGIELEHEILEAEHALLTDKVGQLKEKAKTLETTINETRKEIENPTEVEVELKRRLGQLTDHLIQKQAQAETLSSEKAMLMFRIEAVSRSLEESKSYLKLGDHPTNDLESGLGSPYFKRGYEKGRSILDSIFLTGATFIRRNPVARIWSFAYLVCLHLWVLYIFRSQNAVSEDGSGA